MIHHSNQDSMKARFVELLCTGVFQSML